MRDGAMQRLRDLTLAAGIAAFGALGLFAWISAATIPGVSGSAQPASGDAQLTPTFFGGGDDSQQPSQRQSLAPANFGSGVAVSGGSH